MRAEHLDLDGGADVVLDVLRQATAEAREVYEAALRLAPADGPERRLLERRIAETSMPA